MKQIAAIIFNVKWFFPVALFLFSNSCISQAYEFKTLIDIDATRVIDQGRSATCWSFSTSSFLESEIMRKTGKVIDLSEMYSVRHTYSVKSWNYVMRQGKAQFHGGGLAHDVMNSARVNGLVPNSVYPGVSGDGMHRHSEMDKLLKSKLDSFIENPKTYESNWKKDIEDILNEYLGENVTQFTYEGKQYTPKSFLTMTGIDPDDYVSITSFTHQPYYEHFILNIPHNFSNGSFYNVKLDEMVNIIDVALENGYSLVLECDATEPSFMYKKGQGLAIIPRERSLLEKAKTTIQPEKEITAAYRQEQFENFNTTDDHLMHIVGKLSDQKGNIYYKVKNSWGADTGNSGRNGHMYMSQAYIRLKAISITVHKDILSKVLADYLCGLYLLN